MSGIATPNLIKVVTAPNLNLFIGRGNKGFAEILCPGGQNVTNVNI
jgi:hypothetical protein